MIPIQHGFKPEQLNPATLAFLGDAVYELLVRTHLAQQGSMPAKKLHKAAIELVCAKGQAEAYKKIRPILNEEETAIFLRGRNANVNPPKSADPGEYHTATGLEVLFAYLYLCESTDRIHELFDVILND